MTSTRRVDVLKTIAPTTDESATVEPTDRSIPRVTITSNWPSASTAITAVCEKTLPMFRLVKKIGVVRLTTTHEHEQDQRRPEPERQQQAERAGAPSPRSLVRPAGASTSASCASDGCPSQVLDPQDARSLGGHQAGPFGEGVLGERLGADLDAVAGRGGRQVAAVARPRGIDEVLVQVVDVLDRRGPPASR